MIVAGYGLSLSNPHLDARERIVWLHFCSCDENKYHYEF